MSDRKRKKQFYKSSAKRSRRSDDLKPNIKGFIISCNDKERNAVLEGYRLLNEYADKKYGVEKIEGDVDSDSDHSEDIEAALKKEVNSIKEMNKKDTPRRFQKVQGKAKNVIFIKTTLENPNELLYDIFNDILQSQVRKSKFCLRFLPVVSTCYAKKEEILKSAIPLIEEYFHNCATPFTYCMAWKARCNNSIKREDVFPGLAELIESKECGHTVEYGMPEVVFNLDINGNICCFGVLRHFQKFRKYNIDMLINDAVKKDSVKEEEEIKTEDKSDVKVDESEVKTEVENKDDDSLGETDQKNTIKLEAIESQQTKEETS